VPDGGLSPAKEDDAVLLFFREAVAFDHVRRRLLLAVHVPIATGEDPGRAHDRAVADLEALAEALHAPFAPPRRDPGGDRPGEALEPSSNVTREGFEKTVRRAKEYIVAGDVFQVVLSQRFTVPSRASDLDLFRSLRAVNPSPYMFLLRFDGWSAVGSSPEPLVRLQEGVLAYRPIAGTAPRSEDVAEDERRAEALRGDPKEIAEHVMLVDLGRNDLGRVAETGSVTVDELMTVERYSHVMHLVSGLTARLRAGLGPLDALFACFPAGTVSGAPKVRAMEIIEELEPDRRGLYAGAVGYIDLGGNLDTCIALRTMIVRDGTVTVQAGAGIVADSDPAREYEETRHKARALLEAVRRAEPEA
jgi:anthranilate synthase component 1